MERVYPHSPLASRKAPAVDGHRLFAVNGRPALTRDQEDLLRESRELLSTIDSARVELVTALDHDDADLCLAVARRFLGIGLVFADRATAAEMSL